MEEQCLASPPTLSTISVKSVKGISRHKEREGCTGMSGGWDNEGREWHEEDV